MLAAALLGARFVVRPPRAVRVGVVRSALLLADPVVVKDEKLLRKLLDRLPRGGFRLTDLGVIHDENVICKIS